MLRTQTPVLAVMPSHGWASLFSSAGMTASRVSPAGKSATFPSETHSIFVRRTAAAKYPTPGIATAAAAAAPATPVNNIKNVRRGGEVSDLDDFDLLISDYQRFLDSIRFRLSPTRQQRHQI